MNIADTANNGNVRNNLNSTNCPKSQQASCPFDLVVNNEHKAVSNLPLLNPAMDVYDQAQEFDSPITVKPEDNTPQDWIAEPDSEQQAAVNGEFNKLLQLNQDLQISNSDLYAEVERLKQELAEAEKILQWQKKRSSVTDSMLNQQAQDLQSSQEQIQSLFQQLETAAQTVQSQQMFIQTHKSQLQISQERVAQLERECTLLQTQYDEQSQQLLQSENTCRELRTRLIRQQRQTLQFKAALEKCLDTSVPHYDTLNDTAPHPYNVTNRNTRFSRKARSLFPNAQPIRPWSADTSAVVDSFSSVGENLDHLENLENSWMQSPTPSGYTPPSCSTPVYESEENLTHADPSLEPILKVDQSDDLVADVDADLASVEESNLDRQLESLIEMFFTSANASSHHSPGNDGQIDDSQINSGDKLNYESLLSPTQEDINLDVEITVDQDLPREFNNSDDLTISVSEEFTVPSRGESPPVEVDNPENEDYWADAPTEDFSLPPLGEYYLDQQSPSPLIYPQRPRKVRKSFASVELPSFGSPVNGQKSQKSDDH